MATTTLDISDPLDVDETGVATPSTAAEEAEEEAEVEDDENDSPPPLPWLPAAKLQATSAVSLDLSEMFKTSSDPPLFSSDDLVSASADNYARPGGRRKRMFGCAWFEQQESRTSGTPGESSGQRYKRVKRGGFTRNFDSGVFFLAEEDDDDAFSGKDVMMGEDEEEKAEEEGEGGGVGGYTTAMLSRCAARYAEDPGHFEGPVWPFWQTQPSDLQQYHQSQLYANARIGAAIDKASMAVDLSDLGLTELRAPFLRPLRYVTQPLHSTAGRYEKLAPQLQLYLSNNRLRDVPAEVFNLPLQTLSLRNNKLGSVSPLIARLGGSLTTLNLACNKLAYLPFSLLGMIQEQDTTMAYHFTLSPNPYLRPIPDTLTLTTRRQSAKRLSKRMRSWEAKHSSREQQTRTSYVASTAPAFLSISGQHIPGYGPSPAQTGENWCASLPPPPSLTAVDSSSSSPPSTPTKASSQFSSDAMSPSWKTPSPSQDISPIRTTSSVHPTAAPAEADRKTTPSLLELCLRTIHTSPNTAAVPFLLPQDAPSHLHDLVRRTHQLKEEHGTALDTGNSKEVEVFQGGQKCSVCNSNFIVPRTEWVEWWDVDSSPFTNADTTGSNDGATAAANRSQAIARSYAQVVRQRAMMAQATATAGGSGGQSFVGGMGGRMGGNTVGGSEGNGEGKEEQSRRRGALIPFLRQGCSWGCVVERGGYRGWRRGGDVEGEGEGGAVNE